jgi:DNA mismatch repair protein MutL
MSHTIERLPEALANQIAAGEVVQRPASVLKELIENAIDAGATEIQVHLRDAGKTLIQVIDNGQGMGPEDARLCFERHATSKIRTLDDLFALHSYGFRGEALAATAAVAQVELRTRRAVDELGTLIRIEGGQIRQQEPAPSAVGTSIQVKNLFFNVPARRNFLKSDETELRNLIDTFQQMALARPELQFRLSHQGTDLYQVRAGNLKQRITNFFGESIASGLVPVQESTPILSISGFIGKPNIARKSRGHQYFFLNDRYIRHPYLHHAVATGYHELLPEGSQPAYLIFLTVDPKRVDVNVHPAKTEVKFDDEKTHYAILMSAVRRALSQYQVAPALDFSMEPGLSWTSGSAGGSGASGGLGHGAGAGSGLGHGAGAGSGLGHGAGAGSGANGNLRSPFNPSYNPFDAGNRRPRPADDSWRQLMDVKLPTQNKEELFSEVDKNDWTDGATRETGLFQLQHRYVVGTLRSGLLVVDQEAAHYRILFDRFRARLTSGTGASQQCMFPSTLQLRGDEELALGRLEPILRAAGFDWTAGDAPLEIRLTGLPADIDLPEPEQMLHDMLRDEYPKTGDALASIREQISRIMARRSHIRAGKILSPIQMRQLVDELFACENPYYNPEGRPVLLTITIPEIMQRLGGPA